MRVIHSGSCNVFAGGPALSTWLTIKGLRQQGVKAELVMEPVCNGKVISDELNPVFTKQPKFGPLAYVPDYYSVLKNIGHADLYHVQGVWMLHGTQMARYARQHKIPYIVTLRGMLYPQALSHNSLIKKLSLFLYQKATLQNAAVVQATCIEEMEYYRVLGFTNPVAVLPNPIETKPYVEQLLPVKSIFRVGYLGRIHLRKRIERLIYAMDNLRTKLPDNSELLIIGGGDKIYEDFLHKEVERLNLTTKVRFTGFLTGKEKDTAIDSLSVLAVPSDFENFGNIVTEALIHGVPVIASKGMPWQELPANDCGWWIENDQQTIDNTIYEAFLNRDKLCEMGENGKNLMQQNYSVDALGQKMKRLYEWVINGGTAPAFVYV